MTATDWEYKDTGWTRQDLPVILMEAALGSVTADFRAIAFHGAGRDIELQIYLHRMTDELEKSAEFIFGYFMSTSAISDFHRQISVDSEPLPFLNFPSAYTLLMHGAEREQN